jgi:hypothetical protein
MRSKSAFGPTLLAALLATAAATTAQAQGFVVVTNGDDSGPGSLRDAIEVQQAAYISFDPSVTQVNIDSTLEYSAQEPLRLFGSGQTVATANEVTLLAITGGANLFVYNMTFQGPGGWNVSNRGAGKGIFVDVSADRSGTFITFLREVTITGVADHGVHVSDCNLPDACGSAGNSGGDGAPATIKFICIDCNVDDVGNGTYDADGLRVDDRGDGDIETIIRRSSFTNNGADGVELDEGDNGQIFLTVTKSTFNNNGGYCDPAVIGPFIPNPAKAEFTVEENVLIDDIPTDNPGSADDRCIERKVTFHDEAETIVASYEFSIDLDDGIDLDEAGNGSLWSKIYQSEVNGNADEGLDFDEFGEGFVYFTSANTEASNNAEDGFKFSEENAGGLFSRVFYNTAFGNGGNGFEFRERNGGDVSAYMRFITTDTNDGDDIGINVIQSDDGGGSFDILNSTIGETGDEDGIRTEGVTEIGT